jgi:hypothetical protein
MTPERKDGVTPEGIQVQIGQRWRDLDHRVDRIVEVVKVDGHRAIVHRVGDESKRNTVISIERLRKGSTGYALVKDVGDG